MKKICLGLLCLLLLPWSCFTTKTTVKPSPVNLSKMYNPTNTRLHPAFTVYHQSPSSSQLTIKLFPSELLYTGTIQPNKLLGLARIKYVLTDVTDTQNPVVADTGSVEYTIAREDADKRFIARMPLKAEMGRRYQLAVTTADLVRRDETLTFLNIDKTSMLSEQSFSLMYADDNTPIFRPYVVGSNTFKLNYSFTGYDSVYLYYFGREIPLPLPSFSMGREREFLNRPDSIWVLPLSKVIHYQLNYPGVYHFRPDTNINAGLTVYNFGESYPKVQEVDQLIESLAYLTTSTEYESIKKATNQKLAVDNFWLGKAGNIEKARELLRVYYNRVYFANYYFTSFKPGWKTDRGMIFIVFGPPQAVTVTPTQERWIYYKNNFTTTVTFVFDHVPNAFTPDNYALQRSDSYDTYWRNAVNTWRNGNIYMIE